MAIPKVYRRVNPSWIHYWRLAHSSQCPTGLFVETWIAPSPYIDQQD